jgi:hypothetical protein
MKAISTRNLAPLPDAASLRRLLQSMATLDAVLSPDWECRYYSFNSKWANGEQMGSMRNGCGDDFFALFNSAGCFLKGFAHEAAMSPYRQRPKKIWKGMFDGVPQEFAECLKEPAFSMDDTTFCIWRFNDDDSWRRGKIDFPPGADPDGSEMLLSPLDGKPETYQAWAEEYYEEEIEVTAVEHIYEHRSLTDPIVKALNPKQSLAGLKGDLRKIGYPAR